MKKKVLFVLVLLTMIGASTVFGQQRYNVWERNPRSSAVKFEIYKYYEIVAVQTGGGNPNMMQKFDKASYPTGDTYEVRAAMTNKVTPKVSREVTDKSTDKDKLSKAPIDNVVFDLNPGAKVTILFYNDRNLLGSTKKGLAVLQPYSLVGIQNGCLIIYSGEVWYDMKFYVEEDFKDMFEHLSSTVFDYNIEKNVADLKKKYKDPADVASEASKWITRRAAGQSFLEGAIGNFVIPLKNMTTVTQWMYQSQIAYATALAYGRKPSQEDFGKDLLVLLSDDSVIKATLKNNGLTVSDAIMWTTVKSYGWDYVKDKADPRGKFKDKAANALADALTKKLSIKKIEGGTVLSVLGMINDGKDAAQAKLTENKNFLQKCINYYK